MLPRSRADDERDVRRLRADADAMLASGEDVERVARLMVEMRNALKTRYLEKGDPGIVLLMEMRNRPKYGDPLGPDADALLARYGSWLRDIDAACRPAPLSGS